VIHHTTNKNPTSKAVVSMSRTILMHILTDMRVLLGESETEQLYQELLTYFGLIGASNQCEEFRLYATFT